MNRIRAIDPLNNTMTVEAGCILKDIQTKADAVNRLFPLSLASEGSCTIGGNLSTNAGGVAVLHYGNARSLCLGLEVVTPSGEIWNGLKGLRKDNTGYSLRDLYIGAEGTLGIITAAVLQLFMRPTSFATAFVATSSIDQALTLLHNVREHNTAGVITSFELMSEQCLALVKNAFPTYQPPHLTHSPYYVLIEVSSQQSADINTHALETALSVALEKGLIEDAAIATSLTQREHFWRIRESISAAQAKLGNNIKHDIALPLSHVSAFVTKTNTLLQQVIPNCQIIVFGHLGDGNLHYNVGAPPHLNPSLFLKEEARIHKIVYDKVAEHEGSIAAEHGLGRLKAKTIIDYKSPLEMDIMHAIKRALDPQHLMNPGILLSE